MRGSFAFAWVLALVACSSPSLSNLHPGDASAPDVPRGNACTSGMVIACPCVGGGQGAQTCDPTSGVFGPCVCPGVDAGTDVVQANDVTTMDVGMDTAPPLLDVLATDTSGPVDTGVDVPLVDTGVDVAPVDTGVDVGPVDTGVDVPRTCVSMTPGNCGGISCGLGPNVATAACIACACGIGTCASGHADCNGLASDGCEVDTQTDPMDCGACRTPCAAGFVCVAAACVTYSQLVLAAGPVAYWHFDELAGPAVIDTVGGHNAIAVGGVTFGAAGLIGSGHALVFDGSTGYVEVPYSSATNPPQYTIELWVRVDGPDGTGSYRSPLTSRAGFNGYTMYADNADHWGYWVGDVTGYAQITGSATVAMGRIYYLVAVNSGSTQTLYVDGAVVASGSFPAPVDPTSPLRIGAGNSDSPPGNFFPGAIDEVAIYARALTPTEIGNHWSAGSTM